MSLQIDQNTIALQTLLAAVNGLPEAGSGEPVLQSKTVSPATSQQTVTPDSGYDGLSQVTVNAMPTAEQATPSISVSNIGVITASTAQSAGYVVAGTKSATKQLTAKAAATYTPGTLAQTIGAGQYLTGTQTIKGDANLIAGNIKEGVTIFNVLGTFAGESGGGGLPDGVSAITYGTFTPSSDVTTNIAVNHDLGVAPDFCVWWLDGAHLETEKTGVAVRGVMLITGTNATMNLYCVYTGYNDSSKGGGSDNTMSGQYYFTANNMQIRCNSTYKIKAGLTYHWVAGTLDFLA